ncbi:hypothetical protein [Natronomonas sp.]|uniref:hypothetical protein n=1 Tax=Natronomonas sp. TaxID=2184060 RepID=UPI0039E226EF
MFTDELPGYSVFYFLAVTDHDYDAYPVAKYDRKAGTVLAELRASPTNLPSRSISTHMTRSTPRTWRRYSTNSEHRPFSASGALLKKRRQKGRPLRSARMLVLYRLFDDLDLLLGQLVRFWWIAHRTS